MADGTAIEWTDATWNPVTGCSVVSKGCTNCYAMRLAGSRLRHTPSREGLTNPSAAGPVWNGKVRFNREWIAQPIQWRRPRRIFVCAHGDLFHENVPDAWIDQVFAVMGEASQHTFQVLTKRAARMRQYVNTEDRAALVEDAAVALDLQGLIRTREAAPSVWPLPNVQLGVSAEDQATCDERVAELVQTEAAVRFVSAEPLLGPVDLRGFMWPVHPQWPAGFNSPEAAIAAGEKVTYHRQCLISARWADHLVNWVIAGGESGPGARPMQADWVRDLRDQCANAGVPFFFKQWGEWLPPGQDGADEHGRVQHLNASDHPLRIGKRAAGRTLDMRTHDAFPATGAPA